MLEQLSNTQNSIAQQAFDTNLLPPQAFQDFNRLAVRIDTIQKKIQQIENNPLNMGTDIANQELEQLRSQLNQAVQEQNQLNTAIKDMDIQTTNEAYLRLSQTISHTEKYIRDNVDEQGRFNREISEGVKEAEKLPSAIKGAVAAYASIQSIEKIINLSDTLTQTNARLSLMVDVDAGESIEELQEKIYTSAQNTRSAYQTTADIVAKLGNNAGSAFSSNDEILAFVEQLNKSFVIAGTEASGIDAAMLQLTQAMGSGVLRGEEYNSVLEQAPNIVQNIAKYIEGNEDVLSAVAARMGMKIEDLSGNVEKHLKDIASKGIISAEMVKAASFYAADEINEKFNSMPTTWEQIWTSFKNDALMTFQPVLEKINELANNEEIQEFINGVTEALFVLSDIALAIFDGIGQAAGFISNNWSIISPIIYGVAAALAVYGTYLAITKGLELASAAAKGVMAVAEFIHVAALAAQKRATIAATAKQMELNGAMYACPIMWTIILFIGLIAIIFAVCNAIAKMTGIANSGFSLITGGINVVIQFFKNLGLFILNIVFGIINAIGALATNLMIAFYNAICSIQGWWYGLLSTVLEVVAGICKSLNKLPFIEFDYSGIVSAANDFASKSKEASEDKEEYISIREAFLDGFDTFETFQDGWISDAFQDGSAWGDKVKDKLSDLFSSKEEEKEDENPTDYEEMLENLGDVTEGINGNTEKMADSMEITKEDLKYLRDIAEQETINRFTTAEIKIDMSGMQNTVKQGDLDGFLSELTDAVDEAAQNMAEGVYE